MSQPAPPHSMADIINQPQTDVPSTQEEPLGSSSQPARDETQPGIIRPVTRSQSQMGSDLPRILLLHYFRSAWITPPELLELPELPTQALGVRLTLLTWPPGISVGVPAEPKRPALLQSLAITFSYDVLYCKSQKAMSANRSQSCAKGKCQNYIWVDF